MAVLTAPWQCHVPSKKEAIAQIRNKSEEQKKEEQRKQYSEVARTVAKETLDSQPPKTEIVLQHDLSHTVLTACILAHLNNIAEPGSFNRHLNYLLKKNNLPGFTAEDDAPSHKIFNIASLTRTVTQSQEELNEMLTEDEMSPAPKEQRETISKPKQTIPTPAKELGITVYTSKSNPFPKIITYQILKENIKNETYKITFTANKTIEEVKQMIENDKMKFVDNDLKIVDDSTFRKIRTGKDDRSPPTKHQQKKQSKPWQQPP